MNVFNRIVMIILIIAMIAGGVYFLLRPMDVLNLSASGIKILQDQVYDARFFMFFAIGGGILLFILLLIFWLEIKRVHFRIARVQTKGKSNTWLGIQSIAQSLEYRIDELAGVRSVKPKVVSYGKDVEVFSQSGCKSGCQHRCLDRPGNTNSPRCDRITVGFKNKGKSTHPGEPGALSAPTISGSVAPEESKATVVPCSDIWQPNPAWQLPVNRVHRGYGASLSRW